MDLEELIIWLLDGDISIQYQTYRDLLSTERTDLKQRIAMEGWGSELLAKRQPEGHWGRSFYQPKWTSSHYSLLDLRNLDFPRDHPHINESIVKIANENKSTDGGINPAKTKEYRDVCVNGMFVNYASYFRIAEEHKECYTTLTYVLALNK